ncbi:MAG: recombination protein RecR [Zetaproteobacteria bacterium CG_4_9_14_3_um_filter_49_83]|nr:MAG: recombination protein RecR [Zetaproteobacteria bacterium CG1_02_49_23]PIQ30682.1 MAG: recombination protein RecR [Zetaproteobacteria bacterium CG17_big_fil_post_rev_8_21_14_2_50_50_13]PIV30907.1 MAG: recombination protein RecR [Zetaproteobacteria bacterium CG02_land_8_20_14_3_00_50_9]PIY57173.1 MAG: recombination protein RecR [Zetaproteobacteria bacterium CG_4_10_14_0_8_um_filter_49_80]PJA34448.1 MAG: recombination protein RecR [Zetaproteobacteria bacterium CG_4_9_14_3_um_filter_49_83]
MASLPGMPAPLASVIEHLSAMPGIGPKTAMRLAISMLEKNRHDVVSLAQSLHHLHEQMTFCERCGCFAEKHRCMICDAPSRNHALICVVEQAVDVLMLERMQTFRGNYHVLHGRLSPIDGMGVEQLRLKSLDARIEAGEVQELILATSATVDGEATAHFIARRYAAVDALKVSRIARGVPEGGELEYLDEYTLSRALDQRVTWD